MEWYLNNLGGPRIAVRQGITLTYLHADALGSASLATTVTGTLLSQRRYLPYGETRWSSGPFPTDRRCTGQREESMLVGDPLRGSARRQQPHGLPLRNVTCNPTACGYNGVAP